MKSSSILCAIAATTLGLASMSAFAERGDRADNRSQQLEQRSERSAQNADNQQGSREHGVSQRWQQQRSDGNEHREAAREYRNHEARSQSDRWYGGSQSYVQPAYVAPQYYGAQPVYVQPAYQPDYYGYEQSGYVQPSYVQPGYYEGAEQSSDAAVGALFGALIGQALSGR